MSYSNILVTVTLIFVLICNFRITNATSYSNVLDGRMMVVLAPPRYSDEYYKDKFETYKNFFIAFAKKVIGKDNFILVLDKETYPYYKDHIPSDVILTQEILDPWLRDSGPVLPRVSVQFRMIEGMELSKAKVLQDSFDKFADKYKISRKKSSIINDGGNVVDNNKDRVIVSDKIIKDNPSYTKATMKAKLKELMTGIKELAIIPHDEPNLGHADGQVMWVNDNTLLTNAYKDSYGTFNLTIFNEELNTTFPGTIIKTFAYAPEDDVTKDGFASACGIYVNSLVTDKYIYLPQYGTGYKDTEALNQLKAVAGSKTVVTVSSKAICKLGGSLRCLSLQLQGENAKKLVLAARNEVKSGNSLISEFSMLNMAFLFALTVTRVI